MNNILKSNLFGTLFCIIGVALAIAYMHVDYNIQNVLEELLLTALIIWAIAAVFILTKFYKSLEK